VSDLRQLFNDLIRFEIELWNAVRQFAGTLARLRTAGHRLAMKDTA